MNSLELLSVVTCAGMVVAAVWAIPLSFKVMDRRQAERDAAAEKLLGDRS